MRLIRFDSIDSIVIITDVKYFFFDSMSTANTRRFTLLEDAQH
jgi:hypothetical protein